MTTDTNTREPDFVYGDADALRDGALIDPIIYGPYLLIHGKPVNRWTAALRNGLRDAFSSGKTPVPFWGVLADVLAAFLRDRTLVDIATLGGIDEFEASCAHLITTEPYNALDGQPIWLIVNDVDGWTALLPSDY